MIRTLLLLIALIIIAAIAATYMGWINLRQTQQAQAPAYQLDVKQVGVGTTTTNVSVPTVEMKTRQVEIPTVTVSDGNTANAQ
jgi:hypothetical protein